MTFTIPYIKQKYSEYNELIFGGELPELPIGIFRARSYLGKCIYRRRRTFFGKVELCDLHLRFSTFYDLPEDELDDIIIHAKCPVKTISD